MRIDRAVQFILMPGSCFLLFCVAANAAPPQALDKTVTVSFTNFVPALCSNGRYNTKARTTTQQIYISTKGRTFVKGVAHAGRLSGSHIAAPSQSRFHFSGNKLVAIFPSASGARREIISFDPSFHSCTAQLTYGEESGKPFTWTSLAGVRCTGTGKPEVSNVSCSIADGNVFAR